MSIMLEICVHSLFFNSSLPIAICSTLIKLMQAMESQIYSYLKQTIQTIIRAWQQSPVPDTRHD